MLRTLSDRAVFRPFRSLPLGSFLWGKEREESDVVKRGHLAKYYMDM